MRRYCLLLALLLWTSAPASADKQVQAIFQRIKAVNPGLKDYSADIDIKMDIHFGFIPYRPEVMGKYYHTRPDKHKLELTQGPGYLRDYPNIFDWKLPALGKFNSAVQGEATLRGQPVYHVVLVPKGVVGDIQRIEMWVNKNDYSVPRQETFYKHNGRLRLDVDYARVNNYLVFGAMHATFAFPAVHVRARANARYSNYRFNPNLPDGFFAKSHKS